ncbi:MAG: hypothetical protein EBS35_04620 [Bacteroidetes bacterium]|nr:hypothetical protein [Bacteroidota bacterium]
MYLFSVFISITIFTYSFSYFPDKPSSRVSQNTPAIMNPLHTYSEGCPESITLHLGESHTLKLPAIEGTGYLWIPKSSQLVSWNEEEIYEKGKAVSNTDVPDMVGSPTLQVLTCKGRKTGKERITIEYARPFGSRKPEKLCQFELNVIL